MRKIKTNLVREYERLRASPKTWLVTGAAGFIGSHLVAELLRREQKVVGVDNFSTGSRRNLEEVRVEAGESAWRRFAFLEGDIADPTTCEQACAGADYVLHQAALGSVPRSLANPVATNRSNVVGTLNLLWAAQAARISRFVFASSSSVYGDHPALPKVEERVGRCLSPYAVSKRATELYAEVMASCYGMQCIGLRYFNVFGPRQTPDSAYAAVIPRWAAAMIKDEPVQINGDGESSRDFCYVSNVVQANILAATVEHPELVSRVFNIAVGERTTLKELCEAIRVRLLPSFPRLRHLLPVHRGFRAGDVRHSLADTSAARRILGYEPTHTLGQGLDQTVQWHLGRAASDTSAEIPACA